MAKLLVLGSQRTDYYALFKDCQVAGKPLQVEHCTWNDISVCSHGDNGGLVIDIMPSTKPNPNTPQDKKRTFHPDFVLLRAGCRGDARTDWRYKLSVLAHAGIPCLNSVESFYNSQDKSLMYGKLLQVKRKLGGFDKFPLVPQSSYSDWRAATFPPDCPCVGKVGTASGGLGKMKINSSAEWEDFCSVMTMQEQYFTSEPFISWDFDIRIQKIGNHFRAFRRTSKHWKSNVDIAMKDEDIEVEDRYKVWIEEAAHACGMDICAMDVLRVEKTGKEFILELNCSAIGLNGRHAEEDNIHIRDLVLRRMEEAAAKKKQLISKPISTQPDSSAPSSTSSTTSLPSSSTPSSSPSPSEDPTKNQLSYEALVALVENMKGEIQLLNLNLAKKEKEIKEINEKQKEEEDQGGFFSMFKKT